MNTLEFKRRGDVIRLSHPDYDGIFDDIDLEFDVQLAMAGQEYEAQISMNDDKWRAEVYFKAHARSMMKDLPTKEEAIVWCGQTLPELKQKVDAALALTAKYEPGLYLLQDDVYYQFWFIVSITHEQGLAKVWYIGCDNPHDIDEVFHETLTRFTLTAPDGSIVGE